jgi:hypothetical protein
MSTVWGMSEVNLSTVSAADMQFILLAAACVFFLWVIFEKISSIRQAKKKEKELQKLDEERLLRELAALRCAVEEVGKKLPSLAGISEVADKLVALSIGMEAMCKATADRTDALNKATELLQSSISPPRGLDDYSAFAEDTPEARRAAEQLEIADLVRRGIARDDAVSRVKERNIYEGLGR